MEKAADALPIEQVAKRWIVASDPDEAVEKVEPVRRVGAQPPGVPRAGPRPASIPRTLQEGSGASAAQAGVMRHRVWQASAVPSVSAIYIASPEGDTGKSTIALGILHRLAATVAKVGVFRPITRNGRGPGLHPGAAARPHDGGSGLRRVRRRRLPTAARGPRLGDRRHRRPLPRRSPSSATPC